MRYRGKKESLFWVEVAIRKIDGSIMPGSSGQRGSCQRRPCPDFLTTMIDAASGLE